MNLANNQFLCAFMGTILINTVYSRPRSPKSCNVPNGSRGVCTPLSQCQPLQDISKANDRSSSKYRFYIQCRSLCTDNMVCCPPESDWANPQYNFIEFDLKLPNQYVNASTTEDISYKFLSNTDTFQQIQCGIQPIKQKIVGGEIVGIDEYSWLALLDYRAHLEVKCGGSLITNRFVVTAAHCVQNSYGAPYQVRLAEYNISSYPTDTVIDLNGVAESVNVTIIDVERSMIHPHYNASTNVNDIALIKMLESVQFSDFIKPICLPEIDYLTTVFTNSTILIVAGWGEDEQYSLSEVKKEVALPYSPLSYCQDISQTALHEEMHICAGGEQGKDSCRGDSGGPLMYKDGSRYVVVGILSFGHRTCGGGHPAVYTNVHYYLDWIKKNIE